jgi:hypothetical protein
MEPDLPHRAGLIEAREREVMQAIHENMKKMEKTQRKLEKARLGRY